MKLCISVLLATLAVVSVAEEPPDHTFDAVEVIKAKPGKWEQLRDWFRDHRVDVLEKHGARNMAFLVPAGENPDGRIIAIYRFPSTRAYLAFSKGLKADLLWRPLDTSQPGPELLIQDFDAIWGSETDYSPKFEPLAADPPRVFELRTYTSPSPEKLAALHNRFRAHTKNLFSRHGMGNVVYWSVKSAEDGERKLVYLLAHKSVDAAKESFANFRKDPDWIAAKEDSERRAGGSLTEAKDGVVSEFLVGLDFSPLR
jgi:hypothetical protein